MSNTLKRDRSSPDGDSNQSAPSHDGDAASPTTAVKRQKLVIFDPVRLPSICSEKALNGALLSLQNKKIAERLQYRQHLEETLRTRIKSLEQRQAQDDTILLVINRYWNRLDEDVRLMLERYDRETTIEDEEKAQNSPMTAFVAQLSHWDADEIDANLQRRVEFSRRAVQKMVQIFDRLLQRNDKVCSLLSQLKADNNTNEKDESATKSASEKEKAASEHDEKKQVLSAELLQQVTDTTQENKRLQLLVTKLHAENCALKLKEAQADDHVSDAELKCEEAQRKLEDCEFEMERAMERENKLQVYLNQMTNKLQTAEESVLAAQKEDQAVCSNDTLASVSKNKLDQMQADLEETREQAANRLQELHELNDLYRKSEGQLARIKADMNNVSEEAVKASSEYKSLLSAYSSLFGDATRTRKRLEELVTLLHSVKLDHLKQIERMEGEELMAQQQLRNETLKLQDSQNKLRAEYEMLRLEFETNLAATEQTDGPVNKEIRQFLNNYKTKNAQLQQEVSRFKKKWKEAVSSIARVQKELDNERRLHDNCVLVPLGVGAPSASAAVKVEPGLVKISPSSEPDTEDCAPVLKTESFDLDTLTDIKPLTGSETHEHILSTATSALASIDVLKEKVKQLQLLVDDKRDTVQLVHENKKIREELRRQAALTTKDKQKMCSEESLRRIKQLEEQLERVKKEAQNCKTEEDELMNEMEVTGQAYETMQEQNSGLLVQLREHGEANFKLMTERIRTNQQMKKLKEERELTDEQIAALHNQIEAQNLVVGKLEDKERLLMQHTHSQEKEISTRTQSSDTNKRKAMEYAQSTADLRLQVDKLQTQLADAQRAVQGHTENALDEKFKMKRLEEEISGLRKRLERVKKFERTTRHDEVFLEEIRELKETLTCSSCNVRRKDGVLAKCHHMFCMTCLKTRYENRRRKCPKCNAAFGANDFHRIYLS